MIDVLCGPSECLQIVIKKKKSISLQIQQLLKIQVHEVLNMLPRKVMRKLTKLPNIEQ